MAPNQELISDVIKRVLSRQEINNALVKLKFTDLFGSWLSLQIPSERVTKELFDSGLNFDGSSVRGWQEINESDMVIVPDPASYCFGTSSIICDIKDPASGEPYSRDPRNIARKAEGYLQRAMGHDVKLNVGPEAEFFVFDNVSCQNTNNSSKYEIYSTEGEWTGNLKSTLPYKGGYFSSKLDDLRSEIAANLAACNLVVELAHHEVGTAGQCEIGVKYNTLLDKADELMIYKYVVKDIAESRGMSATFMPKPLFGDNGNGMHCHQSIWDGDLNLFAGLHEAGLSQIALHYIGGILKHARALTAFTNPTTNSYKRLVPGYEAPTTLAYSSRNRSAAIRIPHATTDSARRIEVRFPDPSCNPYLAFSAMLMAGLDGIQNKIDPGMPLDKDIYSMPEAELHNVEQLPATLSESLDELEKDHGFLLKGEVFTQDVIDTWLSYKRDDEVKELLSRPTPHEFHMYYNV